MKKKCLVAMSGGVDSSVAALLMKEQGYDVTAVHMKFWTDDNVAVDANGYMESPENACCSIEGVSDIRAVARQLDIPFYVLDCRDYFKETVVSYFLQGFKDGETPNPCIMCNRMVKFGYMYKKMREFGADMVATGHYAKIITDGNNYSLVKPKDTAKYQTYFLYMLTQDILAHTAFPMGDYLKPEVRQMAEAFGLRLAHKHESQEICFVNGRNYRDFLKDRLVESFIPGNIVSTTGEVLGEHVGLPGYTIGQRKGIQTRSTVPLYVVRKDTEKNNLVVGTLEECSKKIITIMDPVLIQGVMPDIKDDIKVQIRYQGRQLEIESLSSDNDKLILTLKNPEAGIASGQSAVFYKGDEVLGGGIIKMIQ